MNINTKIQKAKKLISSGDLTESRKLVEAILNQYPGNLAAQKLSSEIAKAVSTKLSPKSHFSELEEAARLLTQNKNQSALTCLESASNSVKKGADWNNLRGIALGRLNRLLEARESYQAALSVTPQRIDILYNLAINLSKEKKHEQAIKAYRKVIAEQPLNFNARLSLAQSLIDISEIEKAEEILTDLKVPKDFESTSYFLQGKIKEAKLDFIEAKKSYLQAVELRPDFALAHQAIGIIFTKLNQTQKAIAAFRTAIHFDQSCIEARLGIANSYELSGLYELAIASYKEIAKFDENPEALFRLAKCYKVIGNKAEAIDFCNKALAIDKYHPPSLLLLGELVDDGHDHQSSISLYSQITDDNPKYRFEYSEAVSRLISISSRVSDWDSLGKFLDLAARKGICNPLIGNAVDHANQKSSLRVNNPFCSDQINRVMHVSIDRVDDFKNYVQKPIYSLLAGNGTKTRPQSLLVNGSQSAGNIFRSDIAGISELEKLVRRYIETYRKNYLNPEDGIAKFWPTVYGINGWLINMTTGGELKPHIHESGWVSGTIYLEVPEGLNVVEGNIVFSEVDFRSATSKDITKSIRVKSGSLCLFPSSLTHYTNAFNSTQRRLLIAFDMEPFS